MTPNLLAASALAHGHGAGRRSARIKSVPKGPSTASRCLHCARFLAPLISETALSEQPLETPIDRASDAIGDGIGTSVGYRNLAVVALSFQRSGS